MILRSLLFAALSCIFALPASADAQQDIFKISREKAKLSRETYTLFRELKIKDKGLDDLNTQAFSASLAFGKARKNHPDLKEQNKASKDAQSQMVKAMTSKDKAATKTSREDFVKAQQALAAASKKIPELVELQKKAIEANDAVAAKKKELLAATPEGKVLIDKINELDKKMEELRGTLDKK